MDLTPKAKVIKAKINKRGSIKLKSFHSKGKPLTNKKGNLKNGQRDLPGGPGFKDLPYNAGASGSIPGWGTKRGA